LGYQGLVKAVTEFGEANKEYTKLQPNTDGKDPDEVFSRVPYEKGSLLLFHLEHHGKSSQYPCR
jgi:leukotriene-A4 hydrolase